MNKIKLSDLVDIVQFHAEEHYSFIDLKNNQICFFTEDALSCAENNDDDYPAWQEDEVQAAKSYLADENNFLALPSQQDADEYRMMEAFAFSLDDENHKTTLLISLQGKGVYRRFKDMAIYLGIENNWYHFRDSQYQQFVLDWCERENIEVDEILANESSGSFDEA